MESVAQELKEVSEDQRSLSDLAVQLAALRETKTKLEDDLKSVNKKITQASDDMKILMRAQDLENFRNPLGMYYIHTATRASIVDAELAFVFFRDQGLGDIIKETIHNQTLSSAVKELCEAGKLDLSTVNNHGLSVFVDESVRIRKA